MRKIRKKNIWDTMPKLDPRISALMNATDEELDYEYIKQKQYEERVITEFGQEKGEEKILEEGLDLLIERLNAYQKYFEEVENWKEKLGEYEIIKKNKSKQ